MFTAGRGFFLDILLFKSLFLELVVFENNGKRLQID